MHIEKPVKIRGSVSWTKGLWVGGFIWVRTQTESGWVSSMRMEAWGRWGVGALRVHSWGCSGVPLPSFPRTDPLQRFCLTLGCLDPKCGNIFIHLFECRFPSDVFWLQCLCFFPLNFSPLNKYYSPLILVSISIWCFKM